MTFNKLNDDILNDNGISSVSIIADANMAPTLSYKEASENSRPNDKSIRGAIAIQDKINEWVRRSQTIRNRDNKLNDIL